MNDRAVALLEQYEIEVLRTRKGRGAILCDTQQGCLIFKEYTGREEQLRLQEQVLKHLEACGNISAERLLATREVGKASWRFGISTGISGDGGRTGT